jgi:hypothetical protein
MKYIYHTSEIMLEDLELELNLKGSLGWELEQAIPMQRQIIKTTLQGAMPSIETKILLIFEKLEE